MSEYIPDPIEQMEMLADRMMRDGDYDRCCVCGTTENQETWNSITAHPCSPPICGACLEKKQSSPNQRTKHEH